jgi:hypothetical protein
MTNAVQGWWSSTDGDTLLQGDLPNGCLVPLIPATFGRPEAASNPLDVQQRNCLILTHSCDLANSKAALVALCPVFALAEIEQANPAFARKGMWELVRQGRIEGFHMLASPADPSDNQACLAVDFRQLFSLPLGYLKNHAAGLGPRWRLQSPYLEHLSQAFARFFMRVGLPSTIPPFKK